MKNNIIPKKILFIDDDRNLCQLSKKLLEEASFEIHLANNGNEGIKFLRKLSFDLAICDLNMPVMGGEDLLNVIKNDYPNTDIIIITAQPTINSAIKTLKNGAFDYLIKPLNFDLLLKTVNRIFEKRELISELTNEKKMRMAISSLFDEYQDLFLSTLKSLSEVIEAKDFSTRGHCERICENSLTIANNLGLTVNETRDIQYAALLHDVGKIAIPESILLKPSKLSEKEFEIIKTHPLTGVKILQHIKQLKNVILGIKYHHERFDGTGYPDNLKGAEIPLIARIISLCDSFDAMVSDRPYRKALEKKMAYEIIRQEKGKQFDPALVELFLKLNFQ